ncbi:hypothetical protein B7R77_21380 [Ralstonia solanacearum K60]|uniref:Uncharacterized protein n=1 Tax=Ralstonia solanacearum K60 TaxID=1091042 RepID=A0AAP7ZI01_RALSL|nr:hypothetical protein B7R77_21380 [Ralstonia solanacearum K60]
MSDPDPGERGGSDIRGSPTQCDDGARQSPTPQALIAHTIDRSSEESMMPKASHSQPCTGRSQGAEA